MAPDYQHCPDCEQEYVAGIAACVDCGKPLSPGPLARYAGGGPALAAPAAGGGAASAASGPVDALLAELPGTEAHEAVVALLMERIPSRAECNGIEKSYTLDQASPSVPFAGSLPVRLYVAAEHRDAALEVIHSINQGDLIGEQWNDSPHPDVAEIDAEYEALPVEATAEPAHAEPPRFADDAAETSLPPPPETRVSPLAMAAVAVIVVALLYYFGR